MKTADINPGARYLAQLTIPAGPRTPRMRTTRAVTVVAKPDARTVTVEAPEPVCVNLADFAPEDVTRAMLDGKLRYEQRPCRRDIRAADIIAPAPEASA